MDPKLQVALVFILFFAGAALAHNFAYHDKPYFSYLGVFMVAVAGLLAIPTLFKASDVKNLDVNTFPLTEEQQNDLREMQNEVYTAVSPRLAKYEIRGYNEHHRTQMILEIIEREFRQWLVDNGAVVLENDTPPTPAADSQGFQSAPESPCCEAGANDSPDTRRP